MCVCSAWKQGLSGSLLLFLLSIQCNCAMECVVHGCDGLNKRGFAHPYVLSEHTLVVVVKLILLFLPLCRVLHAI